MAADVDDGIGILDDDPDDLESSDDEDTKIKGVDMEEDTDGSSIYTSHSSLLTTNQLVYSRQSPFISYRCTLSCRQRSR